MKRGLVANMQYLAALREKAKGKGPGARVAAMILSQLRGEGVRPL